MSVVSNKGIIVILNKTITVACLLLVFCLFTMSGAATYRLIRTDPANFPVVSNHVLSYALDLEFSSLPANRWAYYARNSAKLIIEFLDAQMSFSASTLKGNDVFKNISVENFSSNRAFSGKVSRIIIDFKEYWNYEIIVVDKSHLRLTISKNLQPDPQQIQ